MMCNKTFARRVSPKTYTAWQDRFLLTLGALLIIVSGGCGSTSGGHSPLPPPAPGPELPPAITRMAPNRQVQGFSGPIEMDVVNYSLDAFQLPYSLSVDGPGVTIRIDRTDPVGDNKETWHGQLQITATATPGDRNVRFSNGAPVRGHLFVDSLTGAPTPEITLLAPNPHAPGTFDLTIDGAHFLAGAQVDLVGPATATASNIRLVSDTRLVATVTLSAAGDYGVTVTTSGGTSNAMTLQVIAHPNTPTLTAITPAYGRVGQSVDLTLTGTDFQTGTSINTTGTGLHATILSRTFTQIHATLAIDANAALGQREISVTSGQESNRLTFEVIGAVPVLVSISPDTVRAGDVTHVTFTGKYFDASDTQILALPGPTITNVRFLSTTQITADVSFPGDFQEGLFLGFYAEGSAGNVGVSQDVLVVNPPTLTSISPNSAKQGADVTVTLHGAKLNRITQLDLTGTGIFVVPGSLRLVSDQEATIEFRIEATAPIGDRTFRVGSDRAWGDTPHTFTVTDKNGP